MYTKKECCIKVKFPECDFCILFTQEDVPFLKQEEEVSLNKEDKANVGKCLKLMNYSKEYIGIHCTVFAALLEVCIFENKRLENLQSFSHIMMACV